MEIITKEDLKQIKDTFRRMDANGDGKLSALEYQKAAKSLGQNLKVTDIKAMFKEVNENGDDEFLDYKSYEKIMMERMEAQNLENIYLREMFSKIDENHDGTITAEEVAKAFQISKAQAEDLVKEADTDGDGEISFEEFVCVYRKGAE